MSLRLSVIMFAYNEAENLEPVVEETLADLEALRQAGSLEDYQLVLLDDGSTDATGDLMYALAQRHPRITPLSHGTNRGIGAAVKTGFAAARMDYLTILPADGQVRISETIKFFPGAEDGADMVVGYYTQRGQVDGMGRVVLSKGLRLMMRLMLGTSRPMDGVYLLRRDLLKQLPLTSDTFFVNLELPVRAIRAGFDVRSQPVEVFARRAGASKVSNLKRIARVAREVARFRVQLLSESLKP